MTYIIARCACGREYPQKLWRQLQRRGTQHGPPPCLELRDCVCGSTIAAEVKCGCEETDANP